MARTASIRGVARSSRDVRGFSARQDRAQVERARYVALVIMDGDHILELLRAEFFAKAVVSGEREQ